MSFERVWRELHEAERTMGLDPGAREAWRRGRSRYAVWVLRVRAPAVAARVSAVAGAIEGWIQGISERDLHITVWVAGFPCEAPRLDDDAAWEGLARQREQLLAFSGGLRLEVGAANAFLSAVFLEVRDPAGDLARLRQAMDVGPRELRFGPYLPHVTVGVMPVSRPTAGLRERLAPFRGLPPIEIAPEAVELVELDAAVAGAPLETRWSVPLRADPC